jgi:hypothetical protein
MRLKKHEKDLERHFENASDFLVKCQIVEPYVQKGILQGSVCPWEIGVVDIQGLTILEDFHDTLEAMWVWCYYTMISKKHTYEPNIEMGWNYIVTNFERHIPSAKENEGLYNCSHVILCGCLYEEIFSDNSYHKWIEDAGNRLAHYFLNLGASRKDYSDFWTESCFAWWVASCLGYAGQFLGNKRWLETARTFVSRTIIGKKKPFSSVEKEPRHKGPGDHECFSCNANKVLALLSCYSSEQVVEEMIMNRFLPLAPTKFVKRHVDEYPWNANVAMALGKSYSLTGENPFLQRYFSIMDELKKKDVRNSCALPRSEKFPARESWVTFFYAYAYASVITNEHV